MRGATDTLRPFHRRLRRIVNWPFLMLIKGYKLWKTNYIAYDLLEGHGKYSDLYGPEDVESFKAYTEHRLDKVEKRLDRAALKDIFLHIYANPVVSKERLASGEPLRQDL